jgi:hypothetical protein
MKLEKVRDESNYYSQKASESIQYIALAGIAIIWLFKITSGVNIQFSLFLFWALIAFILCIIAGIIQYSFLAYIWSLHYDTEYQKQKNINRENLDDRNVPIPSISSLYAWILFSFKLLFLTVGYILIFIYISKILIIK